MRIRKILIVLLLFALAAWGIEAIYIFQHNASMPLQIKRQAESQRQLIAIQFRDKERKLDNDFSQKKYLATGKTVYDRIFNTKEQTIVELIQNIASESLPKGWKCDVRVEEFIHFILLVYLPQNTARVEVTTVSSYLIPIIKHCNFCLSDVAFFDYAHKSYLFFDNETLNHIEREGKLTETQLQKIKQQGEAFTQFNSTTIQCKNYKGHLFLPIELIGSNAVQTCLALLDTGASVTTVSRNVILQTGSNENDLLIAPRRSFNTANGWMSCPVVNREVNIEGFRKKIEVAVNEIDEINLLGMNYFRGMKYIVDSQNACIYIWENDR
jgi:predicted aspartyl protease